MKDNCVTCDVETLYDTNDHIKDRIGYVEGAGQFCSICFDEIYVKKTKPKISFVKIGKRGKVNI